MKEIRTIEDLTDAYDLEWIDYVEYLTEEESTNENH